MHSSAFILASILSTAFALPAPQAAEGTVALGQKCTSKAECANGADCYAVNSMLNTLCGNFQSSCTSDSQCAFNTCEEGFCKGFIAPTTTASTPAPTSTTIVYLPLGAECNPDSTPCANGSICYATNSGLIPRCGNFQATCETDAQCAYNTCEDGFCNGFIAPTTTASTPAPTSTTIVYLPLGAECNPASTPCTNGSACYATNSGLITRCGNFQAPCETDDQCAYNTYESGLCNGFVATTTAATIAASACPA